MVNDTRSAGIDIPGSDLESGTAPGDRRFRPDVQGLRAVAVLVVVLFHAHLPGFGGGYVGVDVFFVISGFVITGVLLREDLSGNSVSILSFYARRARRIIPAATLVIIVAVVAAYVVLGPLSGNATADDARWASIFLINVHFASSGTNYLASLSPPSVLQNYWSLAVEEQFYLVYPAIFLVVARCSTDRWRRSWLGIVLAVGAVASLIDSIIQTPAHPAAAYFSTFPRVWELALGGLVAVCTAELRRLPAAVAAGSSWLGLGAVLAATTLFSTSTAYPGWAVAVPAVGTALIIAGGVAVPAYGVEIILRVRPLQWIGLISYSLYLWHWPLLTLAAERRGTTSLPVADGLAWVLVSLVLATATYAVVEHPIRHHSFLLSRRWASLLMGGCLILSGLVVSTVELHQHHEASLATPGLAGLSTNTRCPSPSRAEVTSLMGVHVVPSHTVVARLLVVGDSTACTMLAGLDAVGAPLGIQIENGAVIGCGVVSGRIEPDVLNGEDRTSGQCQSRANAAEATALRPGPPNVVLWSSSWERSSLVVGTGTRSKVLKAGSPEWYRVLMQRINDRVHAFTSTGATVVMVTQPPYVDPGKPSGPTPNDKTFERLNGLLAAFAHHRPHVVLVNLAARVCPSGPPCPLVVDNVFARGDGAHYTAEGSLWVARWLMPELGIPALDRPVASLPAVRLARPVAGATVTGMTVLDAVAAFNIGVTKVTFSVTGGGLKNVAVAVATQFHYGWLTSWDTTRLKNGTYAVRCVAYDTSGDSSACPAVSVTVANS
jgi:peptidoglycan/LPS O-acetylase OafA/YrhL